MAENKKSFVLYCDLIHTFKHLTKEQVGEVTMWIFEYANDMNPEPLKGLLAAVCEPIKQSLKRDLIRYEGKKVQWSEAGKASARARALKKAQQNEQTLTTVDSRSTDSSVSVNVSVSDSVNVINKQKESVFNFRKSLMLLSKNKILVDDWLKVRKLKKAANTITAYNSFIVQVDKSKITINEVLKICIENSWKGFNTDWLNNNYLSENKEDNNVIEKVKKYD